MHQLLELGSQKKQHKTILNVSDEVRGGESERDGISDGIVDRSMLNCSSRRSMLNAVLDRLHSLSSYPMSLGRCGSFARLGSDHEDYYTPLLDP